MKRWRLLFAVVFLLPIFQAPHSYAASEKNIAFQAEVWADNWFELYINGVKIGQDSIPITTERSFNSEKIKFQASYPLTVALIAKDYTENASGLEYIGQRKQQIGDGGVILQIREMSSAKVVGYTTKKWKVFTTNTAPINANCEKSKNPLKECQYKDVAPPQKWIKFVNIGLSGGGQHAIATGLDPRSVGVVTVGSLAPLAELGDHFYTGMQQADLDEYADALRDINDLVKRFQKWQDGDVAETVAGAHLSQRDQLASVKPTWKVLLDSCAFTMAQGWGWVADDYSSYLQPWGFNPRDVKVPTVIWQGGLDKNVPEQHGKWLAANMPNAKLVLREAESHLGIFVNYEEEIMQSAIALLTA